MRRLPKSIGSHNYKIQPRLRPFSEKNEVNKYMLILSISESYAMFRS